MQQLLEAILGELMNQTEAISSARLCKRLGVRMSSLLRCLAYLGDDVIDGVEGAGLVRIEVLAERTMLSLSDKGRALCEK